MKTIKLTIALCIVSLLVFSCKTQEKLVVQEFTFKQGVGVNHWASNPIEGWDYADPRWFGQSDVEWIANQGFDHIQLYISGRELSSTNNTLNFDRLAPIKSVIKWAKNTKIGLILSLTSFPEFEIDSTLSEEQKNNETLEKQVEFWSLLSETLKDEGNYLRYKLYSSPNRLTTDISYLNRYNSQILQAVRKSNPTRMVYLPVFDFASIDAFEIPQRDKNITLSINILDNSRFEVFLMQYGGYSRVFPGLFPGVTFPGSIPDLSKGENKDHRVAQYSKMNINKNTLDDLFKDVSDWRDEHANGIGLHIPSWRLYTGWPYIPESVEDIQSIENFSKALVETSKKYNIEWSVYDYNSGGGPMRYTDNPGSPKNSNGEPSVGLRALNLKKE